MSSDQTKLHSWLIDNIEKCSDTSNYVDLNEIKKKYCLPVSSAAIGNCIVQIFRDVTKKKKRCKEDWSKSTQAYYGLSWRTLSETNSLEFKNIVSIVPNDFFVISRLPDKILLGYFTKEIINGNRFMIEIKFESNGQWFIDDHRLAENQEVLDWFIHWEKSVINDHTITNKQKHLISYQTRQDIVSCIMGFDELCKYKLKNSHASIIASRVNSDVVENMFCQQRTLHNGANTNPTYLGYCNTVNSVILGQHAISKKSNAGGVEESCNMSLQLKKKVY
ncbi:unnamed protein product [Mytilus edulis]|uniref:Uncharacterized protein n=1 Tax=Mytilus edulis TaxID=6550 RepID=A0A8S3UKM3_MYTED|nr:unnamed protein product [Mytilus edulis]